jgi:preprotein translocase subunit SecA
MLCRDVRVKAPTISTSGWRRTIPTNRPTIRIDHPDLIFPTKAAKEQAVAAEIRRAHAIGQPVFVGTASVADSERLSALLADVC